MALNDFANSPAVNNYPITWSSDEIMERKQIAQQKWLALFPDGYESLSFNSLTKRFFKETETT